MQNIQVKKRRGNGRNSKGHITIRHRGGGFKQVFRQIDFKKSIWNIKGFIKFFFINLKKNSVALICYQNGIISYMPIIEGFKIGNFILNSDYAPIKFGNSLPIKNIPVGIPISSIEMFYGKGAQLARSVGVFGKIIKKDFYTKKALINLNNKKQFYINLNCIATIGVIKNFKKKKFTSAGEKRNLGYRPHVRGVAMNPVDHPMGGGEGKTSGGRCSVSPWGKLSKSGKTRKRKRFFFNYKCVVSGNIK